MRKDVTKRKALEKAKETQKRMACIKDDEEEDDEEDDEEEKDEDQDDEVDMEALMEGQGECGRRKRRIHE